MADNVRAKPTETDIQRARALRDAGQFQEAAALYAHIAEKHNHPRALIFKGICLRQAGEHEAAVSAHYEAIALLPTDFDAWVSLGMTYKGQEQHAEAAKAFTSALRIRDDIPTRNSLVTSLYKSGELEQARQAGASTLAYKDRTAVSQFQKSPLASLALQSPRGHFDPEHPKKNIIAFSLWGDSPEYVTGALINAQIARHLYVGWTARFYCDETVPADALKALRRYGAQIIRMKRYPELAPLKSMWRFLVSDDPTVNVFVCRDTDSRLNAKELLAVEAWLRSGLRFHIMRDHLYHMELILAGMWGGYAGVLPNISRFLQGAPHYFDRKSADQEFLAQVVWPLIRDETCCHDTYYRYPDADPFPSGYDLPGKIHVGGGVKSMPHWSYYLGASRPKKGRTPPARE